MMGKRIYDDAPMRTDDGRTVGEAHPDAQRNFEYTVQKLKGVEFMNGMKAFYTDVNPQTNIIVAYKTITFNWEFGKTKFGNPISFHMPSEKFRQVLDSAIDWCYQQDFVSKKGQKSMNRYA